MIRLAAIRAQHGPRRKSWNRARVHRLCQLMGVTELELVAYLDWEAAAFKRAMDNGKFPGPACIVLELYEQWVFKQLLGEDRKLELPFPGKVI